MDCAVQKCSQKDIRVSNRERESSSTDDEWMMKSV